MIDIFQGDPALFLDENGSYMTFRGGQPVLDQGIENMVLLALFSRENWPGNLFIQDKNQRLGSDFEEKCNSVGTLRDLSNIENSAFRALQFMIDTKIASKVLVKARNPSGNRLSVEILIKPPSQDIITLFLSKIGVNWSMQKSYPAHERM